MEDGRWEDIKAAERSRAGQNSAMDGVANAQLLRNVVRCGEEMHICPFTGQRS